MSDDELDENGVHEEEKQGRHAAHAKQHADSERLQAQYGQFSLSATGPAGILAVLIVASSAIILWTLGQQTSHFDVSLQNQMLRTMEQSKDVSAFRGEFATQHDSMVTEITQNRLYLREIEKLCMLTPSQREKLQTTLPPGLKDLLLKDLPR